MRARLVPLAVVAAVAAGCGSHHADKAATQAAAGPLVPWTDAPVAELTLPTAPPAPPCRADQLRPEGQGFTFQAAIAGATGSVELRNVGTSACRLTGRPAVRFVGAPSAPAQRQVALAPAQPSFPGLRRPAAWLRSLAPGRSASLALDWSNWCVPNARSAKGPLIPPKAVRITLPAERGSLDVDFNAVAGCDHPGRPSTVGVRPFQAPTLPSREPWTQALLSAKVLTLAGAAGPLHARRGDVLRYSVALRNTGHGTVRFEKCPFAAELLAPAGTTEAHRLNCAAAHALGPGKTLRFEMRIRIPQAAPFGANGLFWELDPLGAQSPEVVSRVLVGA
jgi:Domain of unknown function (DUF4232)